MKIFQSQPHAGFTLIETLVAIFIFSTALVALSGVASRGVSSVNRAKEVVTAEFLAQEGLEMVRSVRDNATLAGVTPWYAGFAESPDCTDSSCDITYQGGQPSLAECSPTCLPLVIQNGLYNDGTISSAQNQTTVTSFTRTIDVVPFPSNLGQPVEFAVQARVTWPVGTSTRSVQMITILTDWQSPLTI